MHTHIQPFGWLSVWNVRASTTTIYQSSTPISRLVSEQIIAKDHTGLKLHRVFLEMCLGANSPVVIVDYVGKPIYTLG